jgi:hypothetical protein
MRSLFTNPRVEISGGSDSAFDAALPDAASQPDLHLAPGDKRMAVLVVEQLKAQRFRSGIRKPGTVGQKLRQGVIRWRRVEGIGPAFLLQLLWSKGD